MRAFLDLVVFSSLVSRVNSLLSLCCHKAIFVKILEACVGRSALVFRGSFETKGLSPAVLVNGEKNRRQQKTAQNTLFIFDPEFNGELFRIDLSEIIRLFGVFANIVLIVVR